jgi:hypothetical protein
MHHTLRRDKLFLWLALSLIMALAASEMMRGTAHANAPVQKPVQGKADDNAPVFHDYKGVTLGMSTEEARKKLGSPTDKDPEQDFFMFNDTESAQVFYDKTHKVMAISVNYIGEGSNVPKPKAVLGTEIETKPDGSMHQLIRYPKAGCWVSYSRTAGDSPLITVTIQKINN